MEALDLFLEVRDVLVYDFQGLGGLLAILDLDLDQEAPLLGPDSELLGLVKRVLLLATYLDGRSNIENSVLSGGCGFFDEG